MSSLISRVNSAALALRSEKTIDGKHPNQFSSLLDLSKKLPFFGFVDVVIGNCPPFTMFSNNDDFVAKNYFWNGGDSYEPMSLMVWLALAKSSAIIFDVGSYTGVYSLAAASQNPKSKIHSFEALNSVYYRLLINKMANSFANIETYNLAVSEEKRLVEFNVYAGDSVLSTGSSMMFKETSRPVFRTHLVPSTSLDIFAHELQLNRLDLMKIDAEGAEHLIFRGGRNVLESFKPDIICEFLAGSQNKEIGLYLSSLGYRYYRIYEETRKLELVKNISASESMDALNTLITMKSDDQIEALIAGFNN